MEVISACDEGRFCERAVTGGRLVGGVSVKEGRRNNNAACLDMQDLYT